jgi:hypothetical protein
MSRRTVAGGSPRVLERLALEKEVSELCQIEMRGTGGDMGATAARRSLNAVFLEKWDIVEANSLLTRSMLLRLREYVRSESRNEVARLVMNSAAEMYFVGLVAETLRLLTEGDSTRKLNLAREGKGADCSTWNSLPLKRGRSTLGELTVLLDLSQERFQEERKKREEMLKNGRHCYLVAARSDVDPRTLAEGGWACSLAGASIGGSRDAPTLGTVELNLPVEPIFGRIKLLLSLTR